MHFEKLFHKECVQISAPIDLRFLRGHRKSCEHISALLPPKPCAFMTHPLSSCLFRLFLACLKPLGEPSLTCLHTIDRLFFSRQIQHSFGAWTATLLQQYYNRFEVLLSSSLLPTLLLWMALFEAGDLPALECFGEVYQRSTEDFWSRLVQT